MDAAQPSGNVQSVGSRPSIMTGYYAAVSNLHSGLMFGTGTHTSIVKQCPGSMMPGSSFKWCNIHGGLWKTLPIPCPVNRCDTQ